MTTAIEQLQQIKGVGKGLATRLVEAGITSIDRLAATTAAELAAIKGMRPNAATAILEQAKALAPTTQTAVADAKSLVELLEDAERLRMGVSALVAKLQEDYPDDDGKAQRQLRKEITRVLATLEKVESSLSEQLRKLGKKLSKADARLSGADQTDITTLTRGLRRTRKAIAKTV